MAAFVSRHSFAINGISVLCSLLAIVISGCVIAQDKPKETAEHKAVRAYLKDNLPSGKFEEIRWWPVTRLIDDGKPSNPVIRLKYRTANTIGAQEVYDEVFEFVGKRMIHHKEGDPVRENREKIFNRK